MVLSLLSPSPFTTPCVYLSLLTPSGVAATLSHAGRTGISGVRVETVDINCVIKEVAHQ